MTDTLTLASADDVADLHTFLQRADRLGCALTRLAVAGTHLVVTVCVLEKVGLLDSHPFVFGMRVLELAPRNEEVDALVETRALLDRLARPTTAMSRKFDVPVGQPRVAWAGTSPPRADWVPSGSVEASTLVAVAQAGIDEVTAANGLGTNIVTEVRRTVWGRPLEAASAAGKPVGAAGIAFAAFGLGFVVPGEEEMVNLTTNGTWVRASTRRGYVLTKK